MKVWWHRSDGATGYDLLYSKDGGQSWRSAMINKNKGGFGFWTWNKHKTYWFAVRAVNSAGDQRVGVLGGDPAAALRGWQPAGRNQHHPRADRGQHRRHLERRQAGQRLQRELPGQRRQLDAHRVRRPGHHAHRERVRRERQLRRGRAVGQ